MLSVACPLIFFATSRETPARVLFLTAERRKSLSRTGNLSCVTHLTPGHSEVQDLRAIRNYRVEPGEQTSKADARGKQPTELQKQADDFSWFLFTANSAKSSIPNAKNGDQFANFPGPLQTALLVSSANGVIRQRLTQRDRK